ncbi:hypothetical protein GQX74_000381 [Glossina fuscipes]|nr:hypothetical protein GQX74_000381 [Glossina fuscipes]
MLESLLLLYGWLVGLVIIAWDPCLLACVRLRCWVTLFTAEKQKQNTITWPVGVVVGVGVDVGVGVVAVAAMACGLDMISLLIFTVCLALLLFPNAHTYLYKAATHSTLL